MRKILTLSISFILFIFMSCESGFFNCKYKAVVDIYDKTADLDDLWYFCTQDNYFVGLDKDTLETKISFTNPNTTAYCTYVNYINGKFYVYQNGYYGDLAFNSGSAIFVLDKNLDLLANIRCGKGLSQLVQIGNRLVGDSSYFVTNEDGTIAGGIMTLIDADTDTTEEIVTDLPGIISNKGKNWVYDGKVYITTRKDFIFELEPAVSIYDAETFEKIEDTTDFNSTIYSSLGVSSSLIINNQLWFIYGYYPVIEVYDLDTRELIKTIDYRNSIPQIKDIPGGYYYDGTACYSTREIVQRQNEVYFILEDSTIGVDASEENLEYDRNPDMLISVNTETLEVSSYVSLEKTYYGYEMLFPESKPESFYINDHENVYEIDINSGKEIKAVSLRKE